MTRDDIAHLIYGCLAEDKSNLLFVVGALTKTVNAFDDLMADFSECEQAINDHCRDCRASREKCTEYDTCRFFTFCKNWIITENNDLWVAVGNNPLHKYEGKPREWYCYDRSHEDSKSATIKTDNSAEAARIYAHSLNNTEREFHIAVSPEHEQRFFLVAFYRVTRDAHGAYHVHLDRGIGGFDDW